MNFYKDFLYIPLSFLIIYLPITRTVGNKYLNVIKTGQAAVNPCSVGISFFTILNNTSESDYFVELLPDECCIDTDGVLDCDSLKIIGECVAILPTGKLKSLNLVAPTVNPLERKGFCTVHVDSRPVDRKTDVMRETIKIEFDTTIKNNDNLKTLAPCTYIDEDPLNECKPVNCEHYYNGLKNFYDKRKKKCVGAMLCNEDESYIDKDNDCKKDDSVTDNDLDFLKSLTVPGKPPQYNDLIIIKTIHQKPALKKNKIKIDEEHEECDEESDENTKQTKKHEETTEKNEEHTKKHKEHTKKHEEHTKKHEEHTKKHKEHTKKHKEHTKKPEEHTKKHEEKKHEEDEEDDKDEKCKTDTDKSDDKNETCQIKVSLNDSCCEDAIINKIVTKIQFVVTKIRLSIVTAIAYSKKIFKTNKYTVIILLLVILLQCLLLVAISYYIKCCKKCCQKKKVKCKFFNYRQDASITTPLIGTSNIDTETTGFNYVSESSYIDKKIKCYKACQKQPTDAKVSMSDDILTKYLNRRDWNTKISSDTAQNIKHITLKSDTKGDFVVKRKDDYKVDRKETYEPEDVPKTVDRRSIRTRELDVESCRSETELQCHDYNFNADPSKRFMKKTASLSTEKGAQACFSNDSVDDFLSEKGILLFGDNISKYSLNTSSPARSSYTDTSSKTSKNNILRHFISYLSRKSKMAVNSEPGKASKDKLELLHMSKASLQSSSDSNIKKLRSSKFFKESRSTF